MQRFRHKRKEKAEKKTKTREDDKKKTLTAVRKRWRDYKRKSRAQKHVEKDQGQANLSEIEDGDQDEDLGDLLRNLMKKVTTRKRQQLYEHRLVCSPKTTSNRKHCQQIVEYVADEEKRLRPKRSKISIERRSLLMNLLAADVKEDSINIHLSTPPWKNELDEQDEDAGTLVELSSLDLHPVDIVKVEKLWPGTDYHGRLIITPACDRGDTDIIVDRTYPSQNKLSNTPNCCQTREMSQLPVIVVHGGAWAIPDSYVDRSVAGVKAAVKAGYQVLLAGGSAVDAVEAAVCVLEDDPIFDAGTGSVLNSKEEIEMDALIMDGKTLSAGAVASVQNIQHPVQLARLVMDESEHTMLVGQGANEYGQEMGMPQVSTDKLLTEEARQEYQTFLKFRKAVDVDFRPREVNPGHDTVGAVAVDRQGCGGYADNYGGAVSSTGHGEAITKVCLAHHISGLIKQGRSAQEAAEAGITYMSERVQGCGGAIVVSPSGDIGQHCSTERMAWAWLRGAELHYGIEPKDNHLEKYVDGNNASGR